MTTPTFPVSIETPVAWGEMDAFAHVNNVAFLRWVESGRIRYFELAGVMERHQSEGIGPILARTEIDYRLPVTYPDTVRVEVSAVRLGNSSFDLRYRVTSSAQQAVVAEALTVIVMFDYRNGRKVPLDETLRQRLTSLEREC